jgi:hypothetical protein
VQPAQHRMWISFNDDMQRHADTTACHAVLVHSNPTPHPCFPHVLCNEPWLSRGRRHTGISPQAQARACTMFCTVLLRHHARRRAVWQTQGCHREQRAQAPPQAGPQDAIGPQVVVKQAGCARVRQNIAVTLRQPHVMPVRANLPCGALDNASETHGSLGITSYCLIGLVTVSLCTLCRWWDEHLVQVLRREGPVVLRRPSIMILRAACTTLVTHVTQAGRHQRPSLQAATTHACAPACSQDKPQRMSAAWAQSWLSIAQCTMKPGMLMAGSQPSCHTHNQPVVAPLQT